MDKNQRVESVKVAKKISALFVDLDETLWQGTIALEEKIILHQDRYEMIKFLHDRGIQIFIVSRNDLAEVEKTFDAIGIDRNLFTHVLANWDSKSHNIKRLLEVTDIRPETAVFVDDNASLLDETEQLIPGLHVLAPDDLLSLKKSIGVVSRSKESLNDSRARKNRYRLKIKERFNRNEFRGFDADFQKTLQKKICVGIPPADNLYRIVKLLFTTHRLNFNPNQFDSEERLVEEIFFKINEGQVIYAVSASQGDISLGLIGAFIVDIDGTSATIENATFSCSSMGLGFEEKALLVLIKKLKSQGVSKLFLNLVSSSTNSRIEKILWVFGFELGSQTAGAKGSTNYVFSLDLHSFRPSDMFSWIKVSDKLNLDYPGMPEVIDFFYREVAPLIMPKDLITNLGSARGEVLGLLQKSHRDKFDQLIKDVNATLTKVDLEDIAGEDNVVGDAEKLPEFFYDETQNQVWAIELLEHTYHPWKVINEMMRVCKVGGYIFITVPGKSFPKHEYPIDMWRIGPEALIQIFSPKFFLPVAFKNIGQPNNLRRTMCLFKKIAKTPLDFVKPFKANSFAGGMFNQTNGIIYFD